MAWDHFITSKVNHSKIILNKVVIILIRNPMIPSVVNFLENKKKGSLRLTRSNIEEAYDPYLCLVLIITALNKDTKKHKE